VKQLREWKKSGEKRDNFIRAGVSGEVKEKKHFQTPVSALIFF
jgi:hypothetical protein